MFQLAGTSDANPLEAVVHTRRSSTPASASSSLARSARRTPWPPFSPSMNRRRAIRSSSPGPTSTPGSPSFATSGLSRATATWAHSTRAATTAAVSNEVAGSRRTAPADESQPAELSWLRLLDPAWPRPRRGRGTCARGRLSLRYPGPWHNFLILQHFRKFSDRHGLPDPPGCGRTAGLRLADVLSEEPLFPEDRSHSLRRR